MCFPREKWMCRNLPIGGLTGQYEWISNKIQLQQRCDQCGQSIVECPFRIFVKHAEEYRFVLRAMGAAHFNQRTKFTDRFNVCRDNGSWMKFNSTI